MDRAMIFTAPLAGKGIDKSPPLAISAAACRRNRPSLSDVIIRECG
jgi:hypothetical protein